MNNNKKFRKSTIVIPALALMVLTAGASATGAVAWFTATRQVTASASTFTAASSTSALTLTTKAGQGTHTSSSTNADTTDGLIYVNKANSGTASSANYLCDSSYDAVNDVLYHSVLNDEGNVTGFTGISNNTISSTTYNTGKKTNDGIHEIYYAVNWQFTFHYETTNPNGSALLFDLKNSTIGGTTAGVSDGFRIAFKVGSLYRVWTKDTTVTYVDSTISDSTSYKSYGSSYVFQNDTSYSRISDSVASSTVTAKPEYLGTFTTGGSGNDITIKCTAWYEGSDSKVVNDQLDTAQESLTASMHFYVRDLAA